MSVKIFLNNVDGEITLTYIIYKITLIDIGWKKKLTSTKNNLICHKMRKYMFYKKEKLC